MAPIEGDHCVVSAGRSSGPGRRGLCESFIAFRLGSLAAFPRRVVRTAVISDQIQIDDRVAGLL